VGCSALRHVACSQCSPAAAGERLGRTLSKAVRVLAHRLGLDRNAFDPEYEIPARCLRWPSGSIL